MNDKRGGTRIPGEGKTIGRPPLPWHLKKVRAGNLRITRYYLEALKTLPISLGSAVEEALEEKYSDLFQEYLEQYKQANKE